MYSIGEFSKLTGLTVKTLRFYHDQNILIPSQVDTSSGYRFYSDEKIEIARVITALRDLEFSINDISEILSRCEDENEILAYVEQQLTLVSERMKKDQRIVQSLKQIIIKEKEAKKTMQNAGNEVVEKDVEPILIAGIRTKGRYQECGKWFGQLAKKVGRYINGKSMLLCYDYEYKEEGADYEVCFPVRKGCLSKKLDEISVREIPGGKCLTFLHVGPYEELSRSYEVLLRYVNEQNKAVRPITREVYIKGPGMIFKGNPKKYLTELQFFLSDPKE